MTCFRSIALLLTSLAAPALLADSHAPLPKFEWGIGAAALSLPDYRGSSRSQQSLLPFPYIKYRGKRLLIDDGIEARLFEIPDLLLSISGNGALPPPDDTPERAGMPRLDASIELGPSLEYRFFRDDFHSLWLELPLRFAVAIGSDNKQIGQVFTPRLAWRKPAHYKDDWKLRLAGGPLFADADFHRYFYEVEPAYASAERPAYDAEKGFSGWRLDFTFSRRLDGYWFGGFVRYDNLSGSVIEDSPLVTDSAQIMAGVSLAWVIGEHY